MSMKIAIFQSERSGAAGDAGRPYRQRCNTRYAERIIGNLRGEDDFCRSCGPDCRNCRRHYERRFGDRIACIVGFPAELPYVLETPEQYVPRDVPDHEVLLVVAIHEQILLECVKSCRDWGVKGVVAGIEGPGWICGAIRAQAREICEANGVEIAFPKPFCNLRPPEGSVLARFREQFHIGYPEVEFTLDGDIISAAEVKVSAPCGATYYVARWLQGRSVKEDLRHEVIAKRLHSYPCTGSMAWDDELGDTVLHVANQNHYRLLDDLLGREEDSDNHVMTPLGMRLAKPTPVHDNVRNIDLAKQAILDLLDQRQSVPLADLRRSGASPAAVSTAVVVLAGEGRVRIEGGTVHKTGEI